MQQIVNPIAVELDDTARLMRIRWDDGHLGEWGWAALKRGNVAVARKHALSAVKAAPLSGEAWKLLLCAVRGR